MEARERGSNFHIAGQVLLGMVGFLHPPTRTYMNPWTGEMFGEGGVEQQLYQPPSSDIVHGDVIMPKLANETAKYVRYDYLSSLPR